MGFINTARQRLRSLSSPSSKPTLESEPRSRPTTPYPDSPPPCRRRIHRRRPSGAEPRPSEPSDEDISPTPPFVMRDEHKRSASLSTPRDIIESVNYAKTCGAYLCGQAGSVMLLARGGVKATEGEGEVEEKGDTPTTIEAFDQAKQDLLAEFEVFERDQVQYAGYLMEGSRADGDDPERARLFVAEGMEIMHAVDRARAEVDRVCGL